MLLLILLSLCVVARSAMAGMYGVIYGSSCTTPYFIYGPANTCLPFSTLGMYFNSTGSPSTFAEYTDTTWYVVFPSASMVCARMGGLTKPNSGTAIVPATNLLTCTAGTPSMGIATLDDTTVYKIAYTQSTTCTGAVLYTYYFQVNVCSGFTTMADVAAGISYMLTKSGNSFVYTAYQNGACTAPAYATTTFTSSCTGSGGVGQAITRADGTAAITGSGSLTQLAATAVLVAAVAGLTVA